VYNILSLTTDEVEGRGAQMAKEEKFLLKPSPFSQEFSPMRSSSNKQ
jgi:hypothetical protein